MPSTVTALHLRRHSKAAAGGGGDGADAPFEQAFSNLAHAYISDKAPGLLDYEVGFQLVDRDDDNQKAIGVFGFKVGSTWLYAPVFFLNGDLKGHELLYIKNQDTFVPLQENWINYLLSKKPASLGEGVTRSTSQLGVLYPDMYRALMSPRKYAGARVAWKADEREQLKAAAVRLEQAAPSVARLPDWAKVAVCDLARAAVKAAEPHPLRLLDVVKRGGLERVAALHDHLEAYPTLRRPFNEFYAPKEIEAACKAAHTAACRAAARRRRRAMKRSSILDTLHPIATGKLEVTLPGPAAGFLDDPADRTALRLGRILVKDARDEDEVSHAYAVDVQLDFPKRFRNPTETGIYDVLKKDGTTAKCLVTISPLGPNERPPFATVVELEGGRAKNWLNIHSAFVWVENQDEYKGWPTWYEGLPDADSLTAGKTPYLIVGPGGEATLPFTVKEELGTTAGGGSAYEVEFDDYARRERAELTGMRADYPPRDYMALPPHDRYDKYRDGQRVHLGQKTGSKFRSAFGDVYVPAGYKLLKLAPDAATEDEEDDIASCCGPRGQSKEPPIQPGDALDIRAGIFKKTAALEIRSDGTHVTVGDRRLPVKRAFVHLVVDHGLRADVAEGLLEDARQKGEILREPVRVRIKYAAPYTGDPYLQHGGPYAPGIPDPYSGGDQFMGSTAPTIVPQEESRFVPDMQAQPGNRDIYNPMSPDPMTAQLAQHAGQKGQREVFDTAMIGSLLKSTASDDLDDVGDLMKGLDDIGRRLFCLYWHHDQMAERYGESDLPELEESLRSNFKELGDLTLFLKERTVESSPDEAAQDFDLGESAES
jgi:hypothetical protein